MNSQARAVDDRKGCHAKVPRGLTEQALRHLRACCSVGFFFGCGPEKAVRPRLSADEFAVVRGVERD